MQVLYRRPAQRLLWGDDTIVRLPGELARAGAQRPLILCGGSVGRHPRLIPRLADVLEALVGGISTEVRSHSPLSRVEVVVDALRRTRADSIVAVGGGSAFVTARAASILHGESRPLQSLATRYAADGTAISVRLDAPKLPIIAVPTTPTTAASKAGTAVTVPGSGARLTMFDPQTRARSILLDPEYLSSSPPTLTLQASLNAFVMAVEGLCSARSHLFSDAVLTHAIRQLADLLPTLAGETATPHRRMQAALVSILVGEGTDAAGGGLTAALSHTLGHQLGVHNGLADAALLPYVLEHVPPAPSALELVADALSCATDQVVDRVRELLAAAAAPVRLRDLGLRREGLEDLAREATQDFAYARGPDRPAPRTVVDILNAAW
ncbi:iron-containing alcohol dehydrogenase [Nocardioides immobilis]|uniref:Iron-containing alcohol dehydrogenase n=1 Tax=Nocardioides immobilis TaxID=2049295 RepID=A0A417Y122_9ACTN|nr:iron-containing alcohol dehydrogenase family protein [Nocardioides immobilis]RHW26267.1 iron-containing alcohol dehydrogenase [Nocardioides immobilis]